MNNSDSVVGGGTRIETHFRDGTLASLVSSWGIEIGQEGASVSRWVRKSGFGSVRVVYDTN